MASEQALVVVKSNHFSFVQSFSIPVSYQVILSVQNCPLFFQAHIRFFFLSLHHYNHEQCLPIEKLKFWSAIIKIILEAIEHLSLFKSVPITFSTFHVHFLYNIIYIFNKDNGTWNTVALFFHYCYLHIKR